MLQQVSNLSHVIWFNHFFEISETYMYWLLALIIYFQVLLYKRKCSTLHKAEINSALETMIVYCNIQRRLQEKTKHLQKTAREINFSRYFIGVKTIFHDPYWITTYISYCSQILCGLCNKWDLSLYRWTKQPLVRRTTAN